MTAKLLPRYKQAISRYVMIPRREDASSSRWEGKRLYSKLETGKFPDEEKLIAEVGKALGA